MKDKLRDHGFFLIAVCLFLLIYQNQGLSADFYFGYNYGYSSALKQTHYDEYVWSGDPVGTYFTSPKLKNSQRYYIQFFPKESKIGFSCEVFRQVYDAVEHQTLNGIETGSSSSPRNFAYFLIGADYRFFADKDKRFNPYLNLSLMGLFYLDLFGGGPPSYPNTYDLKFGTGIKYKLVPGILLNSNMSYFVGNSILSLQLGLEFCL
jgi:hypothetical protein